MIKPDVRALEDMARIRGGNIAFVDWLETRAEDYQKHLVDAEDEVTLRKMQGKTRELLDIIEYIQNSSDILTKQRAR